MNQHDRDDMVNAELPGTVESRQRPGFRKIRMVGCRAVGSQFRGFIGHSTKGYVDHPTYRELGCDSLWNTPSEAMIAARDLLRILAIKYGFSHR
jgi:hypothetical protein